MENDPCETRNLACLMPDLVKELKAELDRQVAQGYTRPMNAQK